MSTPEEGAWRNTGAKSHKLELALKYPCLLAGLSTTATPGSINGAVVKKVSGSVHYPDLHTMVIVATDSHLLKLRPLIHSGSRIRGATKSTGP